MDELESLMRMIFSESMCGFGDSKVRPPSCSLNGSVPMLMLLSPSILLLLSFFGV